MEALVREAEASSESLAAFARRHGIREQTLYWWRRRVGFVSSGRPDNGCTLLPVKVHEAQPVGAASAELIEIELVNHVIFRVPSDLRPARIAELASVLCRC